MERKIFCRRCRRQESGIKENSIILRANRNPFGSGMSGSCNRLQICSAAPSPRPFMLPDRNELVINLRESIKTISVSWYNEDPSSAPHQAERCRPSTARARGGPARVRPRQRLAVGQQTSVSSERVSRNMIGRLFKWCSLLSSSSREVSEDDGRRAQNFPRRHRKTCRCARAV